MKRQPANDLKLDIARMQATSINLPEREAAHSELRDGPVEWQRGHGNANPKLKHYPPYRGQGRTR